MLVSHSFLLFQAPGNTLQSWMQLTLWWLHITCMMTHVDQETNARNMRRGPWTKVFISSSPWKLMKLPPGRDASRTCQWRICSEGPWYKLSTTAPPRHSTTPRILLWPYILCQSTVSILQIIRLNQMKWIIACDCFLMLYFILMCELLSPGKSSENVLHCVFFQNSP